MPRTATKTTRFVSSSVTAAEQQQFTDWNDMYQQLVEFLRPRRYLEGGVIRDDSLRQHNLLLHQWVHQQRRCKSSLLPDQIDRLDALGLQWDNKQKVEDQNHSIAASEEEEEEDQDDFMEPPPSLVDSVEIYLGPELSSLAPNYLPHQWHFYKLAAAPSTKSAAEAIQNSPPLWSIDAQTRCPKRQNADVEDDGCRLIDPASLASCRLHQEETGWNVTNPQWMHPDATPNEWLRKTPLLMPKSSLTTHSQHKPAIGSGSTESSSAHLLKKRRAMKSDDVKLTSGTKRHKSNAAAGKVMRQTAKQISMFQNNKWQQTFQLLCEFQREHGHCRVPKNLVVNSINLGRWVVHQRGYYKQYNEGKTDKLSMNTDKRIAQLNSIGFEWKVNERTNAAQAEEDDTAKLTSNKRQTGSTATMKENACGSTTKSMFLADQWKHKFDLLCAFRNEHGHCRVPRSLVVKSVNLGQWVHRQRQFYKNRMEGRTGKGAYITEERIAQLNSIGFEWRTNVSQPEDDTAKLTSNTKRHKSNAAAGKVMHQTSTQISISKTDKWQQTFEIMCEYQREHGHCRIPKNLVVNSINLDRWVGDQRQYYKKYKEGKTDKISMNTDKRIALLNSIGFEWKVNERTNAAPTEEDDTAKLTSNKRQTGSTAALKENVCGSKAKSMFLADQWKHKFDLLCAFRNEHGHCRVPRSLVVKSVNLGGWVKKQRQYYKNRMEGRTGKGAYITEERIAQLNSIGFEWRTNVSQPEDDTAKLTSNTTAKLTSNTKRHKSNAAAGKVMSRTSTQISMIELGVKDEIPTDEEGWNWNHKFKLLCAFYREHGHCRVPRSLVVEYVNLGAWVNDQRHSYKTLIEGNTGTGASITVERIAQLNSIGFEWNSI